MYDYVPFLLFRMYLFIKRFACNKFYVGATKMAMLGIVAAAAKHKNTFNGPYSSYSYPKLILARDSRWGILLWKVQASNRPGAMSFSGHTKDSKTCRMLDQG